MLKSGVSLAVMAGLLVSCVPSAEHDDESARVAPPAHTPALPEAEPSEPEGDEGQVPSSLANGRVLEAKQAGSVPWVARHGMTHAGYQQEFDHWVGRGFRLVHVSGYDVGGSPRFAAIWEQKQGPAWVARHGMTHSGYQQEFNHWVSLGYRLTVVDGYEEGGQARYAAIWEKKGGPAWVARHGMSGADYQHEFDEWTGKGYRLVWVQGYGVSGVDRYAAIWEKKGGPAWVARHGMTSDQYQAKFNELVAQGYRPAHVSSYNVGGTDRYAAIWEKKGGPAWIARHRMTSRGYQHEFTDFYLRGYRLKQVDGSALANQDRYAAVWVAEPDAVDGNYCANDSCFSLEDFANEIESRLNGNVVKWAFELRRGLTVIQRASGPARTAATPPAMDFTVHQRFNPASVGKSITSVALLQLLTAKGISVDQPVHPYLPPGWNIPANNRTITFAEVLNHSGGLREANGLTYADVKQLMETEIDLADKVPLYQNVNYAVLRVLVASLAGLSDWSGDAGAKSAQRFTEYVNASIFAPLGIYDIAYAPTGAAPVLFYPDPPGSSTGTFYGDWTLIPGSAGGHVSVHELAVFIDATFKELLLPDAVVQDIDTRAFGFENYGVRPDGTQCWGKGGFFPGGPLPGGGNWNGGAQLSTSLVHCDNGVSAMIVINGFVDSGATFVNAMDAAFTP